MTPPYSRATGISLWIALAVAAIMAFTVFAQPDRSFASPPYNSDNFDLADWKLTLPVDEDGETDDDAVEIKDLAGYEHPRYFHAGPDGAMVFAAAVDGATTSGSSYPRSELREMAGEDRAAWDLGQGGTMSATLTVNRVPVKDDGAPGRIIVGQIHGDDDELVRLYYQDGTLYFMNEHAGADDEELRFAFTGPGGPGDAGPDVALGEAFSYLIDARAQTLTVEIYADGEVYRSVTPINPVWQSDRFYFKAGLYLGVNDDSGTGDGQVAFTALDVGHAPGEGRGGLR